MAENLPEMLNRILALQHETTALYRECDGFIAVDVYNGRVQVKTEMLLEMPGELEEKETAFADFRWQYNKRFGGVTFFALSRERIGVDVLA